MKSDFEVTVLKIHLEIATSCYWEHFNAHKAVALILPVDHPKRIMLNEQMNKLIAEMDELKAKLNEP